MDPRDDLAKHSATALAGGDQSRLKDKLPVRRRIDLLLDPGTFVEDGLLASTMEGLPADAVVTGTGAIDGRQVAVIAHDPTVKAGSWGAFTVEKQIRILELADRDLLPVLYLVDSAGGRLTDQIGFYPGRRGAAHIFHLQVRLSGRVPQVCCLFGPSAAGGAYMPAFCDWVAMVDGNASMYLASPRIAAKAIGEDVTLEEMGGARMHTEVSGCADELCVDDASAIESAKRFFSFLPQSYRQRPPSCSAREPAEKSWEDVIPTNSRTAYDVHRVIERLVDKESFFEIKERYARELVIGLARLNGRSVGLVANQPMVRGGSIWVDSADKAARFIMLCDSFNIALLFLLDVPGFMVGSAVEKQGIIRHGAKMISAMSEAAVPRYCVILRKAFAAGYYAMSSPGFGPRATIALPTATVAAMAPEAAVNSVYAKKIAAIEDKDEQAAFVAARVAEYVEDVNLVRMASDLLVDAVVEPEDLRSDLTKRLHASDGWQRPPHNKHRPVMPV